jgi:cytochrome c biogenesis protein CcmG, thiol:disulfide interchange protein DsbE
VVARLKGAAIWHPLIPMRSRRIPIAAALTTLVAVIAVGLVQLGGAGESTTAPLKLTPAQIQARLAGSPAELARLHEQGGELLGGGEHALEARVAALKGYPVVIDKWASWCQSCRAEIGAFQRASLAFGRSVAFIGIDSGDTSRADGERMLRSLPLSYPSYYDPSGQLGEAITDSSFVPVTVFYNRRGGEYIQQGAFPSAAKLERAVRRYALEV